MSSLKLNAAAERSYKIGVEEIEGLESTMRDLMEAVHGAGWKCTPKVLVAYIGATVDFLHSGADPDSDPDPTPWCHTCGATNASGCECGPRAEND